MSDRIAVGLIGYGLAGAVFHAPLIVSEPRLRLKSVATSRAEQVAKDLPGVAAVSPDAIFADREIELVVIATPNQAHFPLAKRALETGKHVVVDKPFTITLAEADELVALAERKGLVASAFQNRRCDGDFHTVRQLLDAGSLGRLAHFESHWDRFRPAIKLGWREDGAPGSGIAYDLGSHLIDQALVLFGLSRSVTAIITHLRPQAVTPDYFHVIFEYSGFRAILHASNLVCRSGPRFSLHGDAATFHKFGLDSQEAQLRNGMRPGTPGWGEPAPGTDGTLYLADGSERVVSTLRGDSEKYYAGITESIRTGARAPVTAQEARNVMFVLDAALRSAHERRTISISQ